MPATTTVPVGVPVWGGVDTHRDTIMGAAVDQLGVLLGCEQFPTSPAGYAAFHRWLGAFGDVAVVGVEGSSSYGAGVTAHLQGVGIGVVEVNAVAASTRRARGTSDAIDAEAAARAAASGSASARAKDHRGVVESIRVLRVARSSAVAQRAQTLTRIKALLVTAPEPLRASLQGLRRGALLKRLVGCRPAAGRIADPTVATLHTLRALARRMEHLSEEITDLDRHLETLVTEAAPTLLKAYGVGIEVAAQLLVSAGENARRIRNEAAFAHLSGVAPIPAASGLTTRHRLNRGGDRQANCAIHRVVLCRLAWHPKTKAYRDRRLQEGLSRRDINRCLKRYVARELYQALISDHQHRTATTTTTVPPT